MDWGDVLQLFSILLAAVAGFLLGERDAAHTAAMQTRRGQSHKRR